MRFFSLFYHDEPKLQFTVDEPWTLFEIPELCVAVAGLNSTVAESHRDPDHYGALGEAQSRWFAESLADFRHRGWLRIGVVHHNVRRGAVRDDENLSDLDHVEKYLGDKLNLLLHGHSHEGKRDRLPNGVLVLFTGSAAVQATHGRRKCQTNTRSSASGRTTSNVGPAATTCASSAGSPTAVPTAATNGSPARRSICRMSPAPWPEEPRSADGRTPGTRRKPRGEEEHSTKKIEKTLGRL